MLRQEKITLYYSEGIIKSIIPQTKGYYHPARRIMGLKRGWASPVFYRGYNIRQGKIDASAKHYASSEGRLSECQLMVGKDAIRRLEDFYRQVYVQEPHNLKWDCHTFAQHILGHYKLGADYAPSPVVDRSRPVRDIERGVGYGISRQLGTIAVHSMVGIGHGKVIHVPGMENDIMIADARDVARFYGGEIRYWA